MSLWIRNFVVALVAVSSLVIPAEARQHRCRCQRSQYRAPVAATCSSVPLTRTCESANSVGQARVRLQIAAVKPVRREQLLLQITATNVGTIPIVWDQEFAVLIDWNVRTQSQTIDLSIPDRKFRRYSPPKNSFDPDRFVTLKSGQSVSKTVDLVGGFPIFVTGHRTKRTPEGVFLHSVMAYVCNATFEIPPDAKAISVVATYGMRSTDWIGGDPFQYWFGRTLEEMGLPQISFESNALTVKLPQ